MTRVESRQEALARAWSVYEGMPAEIAGARLTLSEHKLLIKRPLHMEGRIDQLYFGNAGRYVIVDSKRRFKPRVTPEDLVQLSCYRFMLDYSDETSMCRGRLAEHGYIRAVGNGQPRYLPVRLLPANAVVALYQRWLSLYEGTARNVLFQATEENCAKCVGRMTCNQVF